MPHNITCSALLFFCSYLIDSLSLGWNALEKEKVHATGHFGNSLRIINVEYVFIMVI